MKFLKKKSDYIILIISLIAIISLIPSLFPQVQELAISFVESHKNDDINDSFWAQQMFAFASLGIIFFLIVDCIVFTNIGQKLFHQFIDKTKLIIKNIAQNKKYLFLLIGLYFIGYFSIYRANFWNFAIDDLPRQMEGSREWVNFYRYFAEIGSIFIHTSMNVFDIAPLTQFVALVFISLASFFVIGIFSSNNYSIKLCIASLPLGLFPYFLSNYSYRYDSPYMALSLCISIAPFLFVDNIKNYIISSILCLLIMCTSYQASSGIYVFMAVLLFIKFCLFEKKSSSYLFKFTLASFLTYIFTLLFFSFLFIEQAEGGSYVDESAHVSMIIPNTCKYIQTLLWGLKKSSIMLFSLLIIISFIITCIYKTSISKIKTTVVVIIAVTFCIPLTFGSYLALGKPEFIPRTFIGIGVFLSCLSVISLSLVQKDKTFLRKILIACTFAFSYCCIAFSFAFGNAQNSQKEYISFRGALLAKDFSECVVETNDTLEILFKNSIGYAPSVEVLKKDYPFITDAIDVGLKNNRDSQFILESLNLVKLVDKANHDFRNSDFPVLKETAYHKIQGKDNKFIITFKVPKFKTIKTRTFITEE